MRAAVVLDSLTYSGEIKPTVAVFVNPGEPAAIANMAYDDPIRQAWEQSSGYGGQRSYEYDSVTCDTAISWSEKCCHLWR